MKQTNKQKQVKKKKKIGQATRLTKKKHGKKIIMENENRKIIAKILICNE